MNGDIHFIDILEPRNTQFGILKFMTRSWDSQKTLNLEKPCLPQDLKKVVADSVYIDSILEAESYRSGVCKNQLRKKILEYLDEMAMDKKMHVIRWMGVVFLKICFLMKIRVFVNEAAILKVKSSMGKNPVLFLPTHRSYADFCLMTYLCYHYDIELPAVAAGMDFASMSVVGQGMRDTGAFFMRRSLSGAALYAATLRRYVRALTTHHAPLEFFLEGTRSRANKSLPPKYGMLSMALASYFSRECRDVTLVPVHISYDRLMEQRLFAFEHLGVPKPKESTGGMIKSLGRLNDHYGNIYVNIGDPVSIKEYIGEDNSLSTDMLKPSELHELTTEQLKLVEDIANYVVTLQQKYTVVTITNLVATVLMVSLLENEALELGQAVAKLEWLVQVLRGLGATVTGNYMQDSVKRILIVHKNLIKIDNNNKLRLVSSILMDVDSDIQRKMKGHVLKAETLVNAIPIIELQLYVNPILHYLMPPALIYLLVRRRPAGKEELATDYYRLRKLLKHEYFYIEKSEENIFGTALEYLVGMGAVSVTAGEIISARGASCGAPSCGPPSCGAPSCGPPSCGPPSCGAPSCGPPSCGPPSCGAPSCGPPSCGPPSCGPPSCGAPPLPALLLAAALPALAALGACAGAMLQVKKCEEKQVLKRVQELVEREGPHPYCLSLEGAARCLRGLAEGGALTRRHIKQEVIYEAVPEKIEDCRRLLASVLPDIKIEYSTNKVLLNHDTLKAKL